MCREDAKEVSSRFASGEFSGVKLIGVIKEVAPVKGAETDEILGVGVFQSDYFLNNPVFIDENKEFYSYLGGNSLLAQPLHTWNPFSLYADFKSLGARLKAKGVEGNLKGEGFLKGGFLIVTPTEGVVYKYEEVTGSVIPIEEIREALKPFATKPSDLKTVQGKVDAAAAAVVANQSTTEVAHGGMKCDCENVV